jgi:hypothetical protein
MWATLDEREHLAVRDETRSKPVKASFVLAENHTAGQWP